MPASGRESRIRHPPFLPHYKSSATVFQTILGLWPTLLSVAYTMNTAWQRMLREFLRTTAPSSGYYYGSRLLPHYPIPHQGRPNWPN